MYTGRYAEAGATRADHAYAELKHRLLAGEFPLNVRLGEERLAALIGMSRTPVREALFRLHAEGLVARWADGGFRPVAPDVAMMRHLYEVRLDLEVAALRRPGTSGRPHDAVRLEELQEEWRHLAGDAAEAAEAADPDFVLLDESFHVGVAEAAGNPVLVDLLRQVNDRIRVVRTQDFVVEGRIVDTVAEHLGILEALLAGDTDGAVDRLVGHIGTSASVVEDRVQRALARMAVGAAPATGAEPAMGSEEP